jgi:hypothetical protein
MNNWLEVVQEYSDRTGSDPRSVFVWLLTDINVKWPGVMQDAIRELPGITPADCMAVRR